MAASGEALNSEETTKIVEYQALTGVDDLEECRRKLEQHGWDLERAVHDAFNEREGISGVYEEPQEPEIRQRPIAAVRRPPPTIVNDRYQQRIIHRARRVSYPGYDSWSEWASRIILLPYHMIRSISFTIWDVINFFLALFRADPRIHNVDPVADVENFIRKYNQEYGRAHPNFYHGTYGQALEDAKQELKFLIVYLHGDDHQDSFEFCTTVLADENVIQFIDQNALFWACNVNSGEGYKVSQALRETTYPFLAMIALKDNRMTVVARVEGLMSADELLDNMRRIKDDNEMHLIAARVEREERSVNRSIREEQDAAYLESMRQDEEKERKKQEELEAQRLEAERLEREEQEKIQEANERGKLKEIWSREIPEEPSANHPDCVRLMIKLAEQRMERRFLKTQSMKYLYYFVFCNDEAPDNFDIVTNFPKRTLPCKPSHDFDPPTFEEAGIARSEMLFVHDHDA